MLTLATRVGRHCRRIAVNHRTLTSSQTTRNLFPVCDLVPYRESDHIQFPPSVRRAGSRGIERGQGKLVSDRNTHTHIHTHGHALPMQSPRRVSFRGKGGGEHTTRHRQALSTHASYRYGLSLTIHQPRLLVVRMGTSYPTCTRRHAATDCLIRQRHGVWPMRDGTNYGQLTSVYGSFCLRLGFPGIERAR